MRQKDRAVHFIFPLIFLAISCGEEHTTWVMNSSGWFQRNLNNDFSFSFNQDRQRDHSAEIWFNQDGDHLYAAPNTETKMVMVNVAPEHQLTDFLRNYSHTIAFKSAEFAEIEQYLVKYTNAAELDLIASLAHHSSSACGALDFIDAKRSRSAALNNTMADSDQNQFYAPIIPGRINSSEIATLIKQTKINKISANIELLTALGTRMHSTAKGQMAPDVVEAMFDTAAAETGFPYDIVQVQPPEDISQQNSVKVHIEGTTYPDEIVIFGAHLDSITLDATDYSKAAGADDNASGVATLIEVFRVLAASNVKFARSVEFHIYGAEEIGLVGSGDIALQYKNAGAKVAAMMQVDMNAYHADPNDQTIYFVTNDTHSSLTREAKTLLNTYLNGGYKEGRLSGGASSDHRSWTRRGYAAIFPFENPLSYNPLIHTKGDTFNSLQNIKLSERFAKMALAFVGHYAGLTSAVAAAGDFKSSEYFASLDKDLQLAVTLDPEEPSIRYLAVAAKSTTSRVEVCQISEKDAESCKGQTTILHRLDPLNNRGRFITPNGIELISGQSYRVHGYNDEDKLTAVRQVKLTEK